MREPHQFWQEFTNDAPGADATGTGWTTAFPDGRRLALPIRALPAGDGFGVASLIVNQASFAVHDALTDTMAALARPHAPDVVVGLPTLGLSLAADVARRLGHARFVALGTSRKFWYDAGLSQPLRSITSPDQHKTLYLDPRMRPLLAGRRILLIDDVLSTGASIVSALALLETAGHRPVAIAAAMLQTTRWRAALDHSPTPFTGPVLGVLQTPLLRREGASWTAA